MRILICAEEAPWPPSNGVRLVVAALLREYRREHDVRVLALRSPEQERGEDAAVRTVEREWPGTGRRALLYARALSRRRPLRADAVASLLAPALREELASFRPDVVQVLPGRLAALADVLGPQPALLSALDAGHLNVEARAQSAGPLKRQLLRGERARVIRFERDVYSRFREITVVSERDRDALLEAAPRAHVSVVPNGVDADVFRPAGDQDGSDEARIVFTGVMRYPPNVAAARILAEQVLPRVRAEVPEATLAIVGRAPTEEVRRLGMAPGVQVVGEVPDMRAWLTSSAVFACPMVSGTGIKNKLLEAMACGLPCVATPLALGGLSVTPGREILVGEEPEEIAGLLAGVLGDRQRAEALGKAARAYVLERHSWGATAAAYVERFERLLR
jgi:polysaccharide biosynthesis protein PslH